MGTDMATPWCPSVAPGNGQETRCPPCTQMPAWKSSQTVYKQATGAWAGACGLDRGCIRCRQGRTAAMLCSFKPGYRWARG